MQNLKKEIVLFEDGKKNLELRRKFNRLLTGGMNLIKTLEGHSTSESVSFSPDGSKIASGSYDKTIKIWEDPRVQERRREMKEMMRSLYKANRRTRNRDGNHLPSEAGRKLYDPNIGRKIGEFL